MFTKSDNQLNIAAKLDTIINNIKEEPIAARLAIGSFCYIQKPFYNDVIYLRADWR